VLFNTNPFAPAAHPVRELIKYIPETLLLFCHDWSIQFNPPLVVLDILPYADGTQQVFAFKKYALPNSSPEGIGFCHIQCVWEFKIFP
jgi:hypothetical protein